MTTRLAFAGAALALLLSTGIAASGEPPQWRIESQQLGNQRYDTFHAQPYGGQPQGYGQGYEMGGTRYDTFYDRQWRPLVRCRAEQLGGTTITRCD